MAVDCTCGIQAIGRCEQCGEAFCESHRGRTAMSDFDGISLQTCARCLRENREREEAEKRATAERASNARDAIPRVVAALTAAGSPGIVPIKTQRAVEFGFWRKRRKMVLDEIPMGGWPVGPISFQNGDEVPSWYTTSTLVRPDGSVVRPPVIDSEWIVVFDCLVETARRHGVSIPSG